MRPAFLAHSSVLPVSHSFAKLYERVKAAHTVVFYCDHGRNRSPDRATKCVVLYCLCLRACSVLPALPLHCLRASLTLLKLN